MSGHKNEPIRVWPALNYRGEKTYSWCFTINGERFFQTERASELGAWIEASNELFKQINHVNSEQ